MATTEYRQATEDRRRDTAGMDEFYGGERRSGRPRRWDDRQTPTDASCEQVDDSLPRDGNRSWGMSVLVVYAIIVTAVLLWVISHAA